MLFRYWWTLAVIAAARGAVAAENGPNYNKNDTTELGEVRCFCNQPECVATSYMCKSPSGICYSDLNDFADLSRATHGCLELLSPSRRKQCENSPPPQPSPDSPDSLIVKEPRARDHSLLLCCDRDMCNHVDNSIQNLQSESRRVLPPGAPGMLTPMSAAQYNNELWFKAATIAVPICGAVILVVLIALAVRILKKEAFADGAIIGAGFPTGKPRPAHGGIVYPHSGVSRLDKNAAHAKLNSRHAAEYALLNKEPMDGHLHPNSGMYRDVNLSLAAITSTAIDSESALCKLYAKPGVQAWGNPSPV